MRPLLLFIMLSAIAASQPFPESMTRLSVRLQSPDVPEQSFAAKPKLMYRAGTRYCRTDELPDPENGIHGLMIINEPDVWMVNLLNRTARHFVDPGPTFNCHLAMFASGRAKSGSNGRDPLLELEFGQEVAYFMGKRAAPKEGPVHEGKPSTLYAVEAGDSQLLLFTTGTPERPWAVARQHAGVEEFFWYGVYEQLPFDPKLFVKPEGVKFEEVK